MRKGKYIAKAVAFAVLAAVVFSTVVMLLWNNILTDLFAVKAITFWQSLGLLILTRLLFGGFMGRPGHHHHDLRKKWDRMTPEQRQAFSDRLRHHCGPFGNERNPDPQPENK